MMGLVAVCYVLGLVGHLKAGVYVIILLIIAAYIACICKVLR